MEVYGSVSENSMNELRKFEATLKDGFELFDTAKKMLIYCFSHRSMLNVFSTASQNKEVLSELRLIALRIFQFVQKELNVQFKELMLSDYSVPHMQAKLMFAYIEIFWEINQVGRGIGDIFTTSNLMEMDILLEDIERVLTHPNTDKSKVAALPISLRNFFYKSPPVSASSSPVHLIAREDGVITGLNLEKAKEQKDEEKREDVKRELTFNEKIVNFLDSITSEDKDFDRDLYYDAMQTPTEPTTELTEVLRIFEKIETTFLPAMQQNDELHRNMYWEVVKRWFLVASHKNEILSRFYKYARETLNVLPRINSQMENFEQDVTSWINRLGDGNWVTNKAADFKSIKDHLLWYLMIGPKRVLMKLLNQSIRDSNVVPAITKILRDASALFSQKTDAGDGNDKRPLLAAAFVKLFEDNYKKWTTEDEEERFVYAMTSLSRQKINRDPTGEHEAITEECIMNGSVLVSHFVQPLIFKHTGELMCLKLLLRTFSSSSSRDTPFAWTTSLGQNDMDGELVQSPELFLLIHDILTTNEMKNQILANKAKEVLHRLSQKLRADDVVFNEPTCFRVLNRFNGSPWYLKYMVGLWCGPVLGSPKPQVPAGLFNSFSLTEQEKCEVIVADFGFHPVECFFRSIFELALMDANQTLKLLTTETIACKPENDRLYEKMAISLIRAVAQPYLNEKVAEIFPVLQRLCDIIDPKTSISVLEQLSTCSFEAIQKLRPLLIIQSAVKISIEQSQQDQPIDPKSASDPMVRDIKCVANRLLQAYCEISRNFVDEASNDLQEDHYRKIKIRNGELSSTAGNIWSLEVSERVNIEMNILFGGACSIASLMSDRPCDALHVLINKIVDIIPPLQKAMSAKFLDSIPTGSLENKIVYAYAQPTKTAASCDNNATSARVSGDSRAPVVSSTIPSSITSESRVPVTEPPHFVENKLFDQQTTPAPCSPASFPTWNNQRCENLRMDNTISSEECLGSIPDQSVGMDENDHHMMNRPHTSQDVRIYQEKESCSDSGRTSVAKYTYYADSRPMPNYRSQNRQGGTSFNNRRPDNEIFKSQRQRRESFRSDIDPEYERSSQSYGDQKPSGSGYEQRPYRNDQHKNHNQQRRESFRSDIDAEYERPSQSYGDQKPSGSGYEQRPYRNDQHMNHNQRVERREEHLNHNQRVERREEHMNHNQRVERREEHLNRNQRVERREEHINHNQCVERKEEYYDKDMCYEYEENARRRLNEQVQLKPRFNDCDRRLNDNTYGHNYDSECLQQGNGTPYYERSDYFEEAPQSQAYDHGRRLFSSSEQSQQNGFYNENYSRSNSMMSGNSDGGRNEEWRRHNVSDGFTASAGQIGHQGTREHVQRRIETNYNGALPSAPRPPSNHSQGSSGNGGKKRFNKNKRR